MDAENVAKPAEQTEAEAEPEQETEDIPSDFFDDFNKAEFIEGLSVIDSWDDGPKQVIGQPRNNAETVEAVKDIGDGKEAKDGREDKKDDSKRRSADRKRSHSRDLDRYIKPGSRRDPSKTIEAIKRDKDSKVKDYLAKSLESSDDIRPPGTELDDYYEAGKKKSVKAEPRRSRSPRERRARESPRRSPPRRRDSPPRRRRDSPRRSPRGARQRSPRRSPLRPSLRRSPLKRRLASPGREPARRWSPHRTQRSPLSRRSPRRASPPPRRSPAPRRRRTRSRSRSPAHRNYHSPDNFLYPHDSSYPVSNFEPSDYVPPPFGPPRPLMDYPGPVGPPGPPMGYDYGPGGMPMGPPYGGYGPPGPPGPPGPFYPGPPIGPPPGQFVPPMMIPQPVLAPMPVPMPVPAPVPAPAMVPAPQAPSLTVKPLAQLLANPEKPSTNSTQKTPYDALAQLLADGKISKADYLKLTPNRGQLPPICGINPRSTPMELKQKVELLSRCQSSVSVLEKLHLPSRLVMRNHLDIRDAKALPQKFCSPLKRQPPVEFHYTQTSGSSRLVQNKQLIDSIIATLGLDKTVVIQKKKEPKNMKDAACQTVRPYCEVCDIRESITFLNEGTSIDPEHFCVSVHTQVLEQDLASSKIVFTQGGAGSGEPMCIAQMTPAQLLSQLAAKAKTLKAPMNEPEQSRGQQYMRRPQNHNQYDGGNNQYDGGNNQYDGGNNYYNDRGGGYSNYRY